MTKDEMKKFKQLLEAEKTHLESELKSVGRKNPDIKGDWEATAEDLNIERAEVEERASEISDFEGRSAIEFEFEGRYNEVRAALQRIEKGTYGKCVICSKEIERDRLGANPAARTCKEHRDAKIPENDILFS